MDAKYSNNPFFTEQEDLENSPENSGDSRLSGTFFDGKMASTSSPKRSRRSIQKRVVSVPIRDVDGSKLKGETSAPPSDSWAWRKYGQKPIKGSPYPRGYYRCSSSKGCPARKQVERSRVDPTMVVVTYSCEHNHPWPAGKNYHHHQKNHHQTATVATSPEVAAASISEPEPADIPNESEPNSDPKFTNLPDGAPIGAYEFGWFSDFESVTCSMLESSVMSEAGFSDADMATIFLAREEEDSLFAGLGELPECSMVFRRGAMAAAEEERLRCTLTPWCGTTG